MIYKPLFFRNEQRTTGGTLWFANHPSLLASSSRRFRPLVYRALHRNFAFLDSQEIEGKLGSSHKKYPCRYGHGLAVVGRPACEGCKYHVRR